MKNNISNTLVAFKNPTSIAAEQFRVLCAKLNRLLKNSGPRVIAVTSSMKGEGKTLTSINLAISMAKDFDRKVLLVEADLKNPSIANLLGKKMNGGFGHILDNKTSLEKAGYSFFSEKLMILPAGSRLSNEMNLLSSERPKKFLDEMRERFDYIFVDLPPLLPLADAGMVTDLVDGVVMVIRAGQTPKNIVKRAMADLDQKKIIGIVLNDVKNSLGYYYYHQPSH